MNANGTIDVTFVHPRNSHQTMPAGIYPDCTGRQAIEVLTSQESGPFMDPGGNYSFALRGTQIGLDDTFASAGIQDGDTINVVQPTTGAGRR
jgi:hypothetical protein